MWMSVTLNLLFLAIAASYDGRLTDGGYRPPVGFATGSPWPMPASMTTTTDAQVVEAMLFRFKATGYSCNILEEAFVRYFDIIFHGQPSYKKPSGNDDVNKVEMQKNQPLLFKVTGLTSLDVAVDHQCENWPSLEMDESCKLSVSVYIVKTA